MTEDFANRRKKRGGGATRTAAPRQAAPREPAAAPDGGGASSPFGFAAGLCTGLALAALVWYVGWLPERTPQETASAREQADVPPPGIRFEFPDLLREAEVLVPYVEEYLQQEPAPEAGVDYLLQAGAFKNAEDADRRRAAILLLDLDARTLRVTRQGESWHRVLVGPFADRSGVREAQRRLLSEDIDSIVLKTQASEDTGA